MRNNPDFVVDLTNDSEDDEPDQQPRNMPHEVCHRPPSTFTYISSGKTPIESDSRVEWYQMSRAPNEAVTKTPIRLRIRRSMSDSAPVESVSGAEAQTFVLASERRDMRSKIMGALLDTTPQSASDGSNIHSSPRMPHDASPAATSPVKKAVKKTITMDDLGFEDAAGVLGRRKSRGAAIAVNSTNYMASPRPAQSSKRRYGQSGARADSPQPSPEKKKRKSNELSEEAEFVEGSSRGRGKLSFLLTGGEERNWADPEYVLTIESENENEWPYN